MASLVLQMLQFCLCHTHTHACDLASRSGRNSPSCHHVRSNLA